MGVRLEERSSSRLSSCSEPLDLWLEPGSPLDTRHCFQSSFVRPKGIGQCGCPAVPGGLEERVGMGHETALTPPVARTPKPRLLLCSWGGPLFYSICYHEHLVPVATERGCCSHTFGGTWGRDGQVGTWSRQGQATSRAGQAHRPDSLLPSSERMFLS